MKKRVISLVVCLCLVLCFVPVAARVVKMTREPLKILAIGSSFGVDGITQLASIAEAEGMGDIVMGNLYAGACTLNRHAKNANWGKEFYYYYKFDSRTNANGQWDTAVERVLNGPNDIKSAATMDHGLLDEEWDIVIMQQSAAEGGVIDTFNKDMTTLITHVQEMCPDAKLYWHMTWAFPETHAENEKFIKYHNGDTMAMYQGIVEAMNGKVVPLVEDGTLNGIIPSGTAIQNARTTRFKDLLHRDTQHLSTLGRVIAGYLYYATFTGKSQLTEVNLTAAPGDNRDDALAELSLTDADRALILKVVNSALSNPFEITALTEQ